MGKPRKSRRDLPLRVYLKHSAYYYVHPNNRWERLAAVGQEQEMRVKWANLEQPNEAFGTVSALIDDYLSLYAATSKAPRTYKDNIKESVYLKLFFGHMRPQDIQPRHIGAYLQENKELRPVRANREKALLSHIFTWAMIQDDWGSVVLRNPCLGVTRNRETKRIRIVEDAEYTAVFNLANRSVQRLMTLVYRTLQRPSDLLKISSKNIIERTVNGEAVKVLHLKQSKTGAIVEIIISQEIKSALYDDAENHFDPSKKSINTCLILNRKGEAYTLDGINSIFATALNKYRTNIKNLTGERPIPFGIYDLKGKGVTDMYQSGIPIEYIQVLAGHESIKTTEIYIKARLNKPVTSNLRIIGS